MTKKLKQYLTGKSRETSATPKPIIVNWLQSPGMQKSLEVIDKHVAYLRSNAGGEKLKEWFFSGDAKFTTITAERYIVWYLRQKNQNLVDHLKGAGTDAHLDLDGEQVGVEITTLNAFNADWIFTERLVEFCRKHQSLQNKGLEVTSSVERLKKEFGNNNIHHLNRYIQDASQALLMQDNEKLYELQIEVDYQGSLPGSISWRHRDSDTFPWEKVLTYDLLGKLKPSPKNNKNKQFGQYDRNLVFVGVNNASPSNWDIPGVFEALGKPNISYQEQVNSLKNYWKKHLSQLNKVLGICFFVYSLEQEEPFYPLTMIWRSGTEKIDIAL